MNESEHLEYNFWDDVKLDMKSSSSEDDFKPDNFYMPANDIDLFGNSCINI